MNDYELVYLAQEENESAYEMLLQKYNMLIALLISKKEKKYKKYQIEYIDLYNDCLKAFNRAIYKYNPNCDACFATFVSVVINNQITNSSRRLNSQKQQNINSTLSLDYEHEGLAFSGVIPSYAKDPLQKITEYEKILNLNNLIKKNLSKLEYEVYILLLQNINYQQIAYLLEKSPKQIDNAIQRLKNKIKKLLKN